MTATANPKTPRHSLAKNTRLVFSVIRVALVSCFHRVGKGQEHFETALKKEQEAAGVPPANN